MARGRPALATRADDVGVIALAVPGSTAFAGEFLDPRRRLQQGWGYAVVGAVAIVLAAMYMLRLISAVLHRDAGLGRPETRRDLRPGELAILVPLVACLLALSVWPAAITEHAFGSRRDPELAAPLGSHRVGDADDRRRPPSTGSRSRRCCALLARRGASACSPRCSSRAAAGAPFCRGRLRRSASPARSSRGRSLYDRDPDGRASIVARRDRPRPLRRRWRRSLIARRRPRSRCSSPYARAACATTTSASTTRCSPPPAAG